MLLTVQYVRRYKPHTMPNVSLVLADLDLGEIPVQACSWLADQGDGVTQGDRLSRSGRRRSVC